MHTTEAQRAWNAQQAAKMDHASSALGTQAGQANKSINDATPLRRQLDSLRRQVINAEQNLDALAMRIDGVLSPPTPTPGTVAAPRERIAESPLAQELAEVTARLEQLNDTILYTINRIEL